MPLISPEYLSTYQIFRNKISNNYIILESFVANETQDVTPVNLIQGDLGTKALDIGGKVWNTTLSAPVFIFDDVVPIDSTLNFLLAALNDLMFVLYSQNDTNLNNTLNALLSEININISGEKVVCSAKILSDNSISPIWIDVATSNELFRNNFLIGRVAKNIDTALALGDITSYVMGGDININVDYDTKYFVNSTYQVPHFVIKGYKVSGRIKIANSIPNFNPKTIIPQGPNILTVHNTNFYLRIGDYFILDFTRMSNGYPVYVEYRNIEKTVESKTFNSLEISFESYAVR